MLGLGFIRRSNAVSQSVQSNKPEGIYLDDLLKSNQNEIDPELASMYLESR